MNIEDQVCEIEHAKRLKELGLKQESYFVWAKHTLMPSLAFDGWENYHHRELVEPYLFAAFTVAELGAMLPDWSESVKRAKDDWVCIVRHKHNDINDHAFGDTEANCRARMLIYLIENDLLKVEK